jgi:hypothetical protein
MNKLPMILVLIFYFPLFIAAQQPVLYANQVPQFPNNKSAFLTFDSFEKVYMHYVNAYGQPDEELIDGESKLVRFYLKKSPHETRSVSIEHLRGNERAIPRIFSELKSLVGRNIITEARYNELEDKYSMLQKHYYIFQADEAGKFVSKAEIIYRKYQKKAGMGSTFGTDMEASMAIAQELMMSGKMKEGMELLEKAKKEQLNAVEYAKSDAVADDWVACLEEISANKYQVRINY